MLLHSWARPSSGIDGTTAFRVEQIDRDIRIADSGEDFSLIVSRVEAESLRDKLSAVLDAQVMQQVAA